MDHQEYVKPHHGGYVRYTALAFCFDAKKRERGRTCPHRQSGERRTVSKQNASPVFHTKQKYLQVLKYIVCNTYDNNVVYLTMIYQNIFNNLNSDISNNVLG
jgi:hypothetical protein